MSYLVMPLFKVSLSDAISRLAIGLKRRVIFHVSLGLEYMHEQGCFHQDIKPENILLSTEDPLHAVLGDLGLVRDGQDGPFGGTGRYMAPELKTTRQATVATDVYSLGVTLLDTVDFERTNDQKGPHKLRLGK